jgi:hypothetical protein
MSSPFTGYTWQSPVTTHAKTDSLDVADINRVEGNLAYLTDMQSRFFPQAAWSYSPVALDLTDYLDTAHLAHQRALITAVCDYFGINRSASEFSVPYVTMSRQYIDADWWNAWENAVRHCWYMVAGLVDSSPVCGVTVSGSDFEL